MPLVNTENGLFFLIKLTDKMMYRMANQIFYNKNFKIIKKKKNTVHRQPHDTFPQNPKPKTREPISAHSRHRIYMMPSATPLNANHHTTVHKSKATPQACWNAKAEFSIN